MVVDFGEKYLKYKMKYYNTKMRGGATDIMLPPIAIPDSTNPTESYIGFYYPGYDTTIDTHCNSGYFGNFYNTSFKYNGYTFKNAEAAFQACKDWGNVSNYINLSGDGAFQEIRKVSSDKIDRSYHLRTYYKESFPNQSFQAMYEILSCKFNDNVILKQRLLDSKDAYLIEHNNKADRDTIWSNNSDGSGSNALGLLLMIIRIDIKPEKTEMDDRKRLTFYGILNCLTGRKENIYTQQDDQYIRWWKKMIITGTQLIQTIKPPTLIHAATQQLHPSSTGTPHLRHATTQGLSLQPTLPGRTDEYFGLDPIHRIPLYNITLKQINKNASAKIQSLKDSWKRQTNQRNPDVYFIQKLFNNQLLIVFKEKLSINKQNYYITDSKCMATNVNEWSITINND